MSKDRLLQGLKEDLEDEWAAIHRYTSQARSLFAIADHELREKLQRGIIDEFGHVSFLIDAITGLGGSLSAEGQLDPTSLLQLDLEMEINGIRCYRERIQHASDLGLVHLRVGLSEIVANEAVHADQLRRLLSNLDRHICHRQQCQARAQRPRS